MATTCMFEHCETPATMGEQRLNFTARATGHLWYADVPMCDECYELAHSDGQVFEMAWDAISKLPASKGYRSPAKMKRVAFNNI